MPRLVIEFLIPFEDAADDDGARDKKQIRAHHDHQHGDKEQRYGRDGVIDFDGDNIRGDEQRRAEQAERNAAVRARRIYAQLSSLCEDARSRYLDSGEEIAALAADLSTGLARLQDAFAEVQVIFDDAQNAFDDMQLPETGAEETEEEA